MISGLGVFSLLAEIFNVKRILFPVVILGLIAAAVLLVFDWNHDTSFYSNMLTFEISQVRFFSGTAVVDHDEPDFSAAEASRSASVSPVTRNGTPVAIQDYLGAKGHLVALRDGDLAYLHVHADEDRLAFEADFPTAGAYRLFLQFEHGGEVRTASFTVDAEEA